VAACAPVAIMAAAAASKSALNFMDFSSLEIANGSWPGGQEPVPPAEPNGPASDFAF
jgi:hypothetical protein